MDCRSFCCEKYIDDERINVEDVETRRMVYNKGTHSVSNFRIVWENFPFHRFSLIEKKQIATILVCDVG